MCLRVLITNHSLREHSGTELYVRDVALELHRQGHLPAVYTSRTGTVSDELSEAGIPVTSSLKRLDFKPDIIHGHHRYETLTAVRRFSDTPALFICHNHDSWLEIPPLHPDILRYYGVSEVCIDRLRASGVPTEKIGQVFNFVDLRRFAPRPPLPEKPNRALVFSNYAAHDTYLPVIEEACKRAGIQLDVVGRSVGNPVSRPEDVLGEYDIVFAKAKAAMEAMATGCAVILCDFGGVGPMVTTADFVRLRKLNFGFQALTEPHTPDSLMTQIARYDPRDAEGVRDKLRSCAGLEQTVGELVDIYRQIISEHETTLRPRRSKLDIASLATIARYRAAYGAISLWETIPPQQRNSRGLKAMKRAIRRIICGRSG